MTSVSPMHVAELWRYPVKSMAGERMAETDVRIDGIPGDRALYVVDARGEIVSARTRPLLLGHRATIGADGAVLVDGRPWDSPEVAADVEAAAGPGARIVPAAGPERFDILPLLVATDGAIADVVIALADLRGRCIVTTYDPDTIDQDVDVLLGIRAQFGGTLALNAWAGRPGRIAVGDAAELLDAVRPVDLPLVGRFVASPASRLRPGAAGAKRQQPPRSRAAR